MFVEYYAKIELLENASFYYFEEYALDSAVC